MLLTMIKVERIKTLTEKKKGQSQWATLHSIILDSNVVNRLISVRRRRDKKR